MILGKGTKSPIALQLKSVFNRLFITFVTWYRKKQMKKLRLLLLPFSWLYGAILFFRHFIYDRGFANSYGFDKPVIVIGNLVLGGAGKSPMTEYLLRLFAGVSIATLSRGYGRKSTGYLEVQGGSTAEKVGDEPLQFKRKFPCVTVAVCEDRVGGLRQLMPSHDIFVLDDAFQHRRLKPGISILLFDFESLQENKWVLPAGNYRDLFMRRNFADIIVITKSPEALSKTDRQRCLQLLKLERELPTFFSYIEYGDLVNLMTDEKESFPINARLIVMTGIANPTPFCNYLTTKGNVLKMIEFPDHHRYTAGDLLKIKRYWQSLGDCLIVTTEKDAMRLRDPELRSHIEDLPLHYIPIETKFHHNASGPSFDNLIKDQVFGKQV